MRFLIFIIGMLFAFNLSAQQHSPKVISNGGGTEQTSNKKYRIDYTIGQPYLSNKSLDTTKTHQFSKGYQQHLANPVRYDIGKIPSPIKAIIGSSIEFFVYSKRHGTNAKLEMIVDDPVLGQLYFSGFTGYFKYDTDTLDQLPFFLTFTGSLNGDTVKQTVRIDPYQPLVRPPHKFFAYTSGEFDVGPNGTVSYSLPINTSPGTAGIQPELALVYNGATENGILGIGWSLSGLSAISRSPQTYAQDNRIDGVDFDDNDRFSLDGQRLVVVNGGVYGANGTEYFTEQNTFQKITSFSSNGITKGFEVKTKGGTIMEYGNTDNSRIEASRRNTVMFWALNRISDTKGNYIDFDYYEDYANGEYYPKEIRYTGNEAANLTPYAKIVFEYEDRPDPITNYVYRSVVAKSKRLKAIKCYYDDYIIREYNFEYAQTVISKLIKVTEYGIGGKGKGDQLAPVEFKWNANTLFNLEQIENAISKSEFSKDISMIPGDYNHDGFSDILLYNRKTGANTWMMNDGYLSFKKYTNKIDPDLIKNGEGLKFGDFNGDGRPDIMHWKQSTGENNWFLNKPDTSAEFGYDIEKRVVRNIEIKKGTQLYFGDYNGDGLTDFFWYDKETGNTSWYLNEFFVKNELDFSDRDNNLITFDRVKKADALYTGDWNADGLADVMVWFKNTGNNFWFLNKGIVDNEIDFHDEETPIVTTEIKNGTNLYFGDWNGDGISDLMWFDEASGKNHWFVNKGDFTFESTRLNPISPEQLKGRNTILYINDWNADGYTDLMWNNYQSGATKWYVNKGKFEFGKNDYLMSNEKMKKGSGFLFGDWKGTGHAGMAWYNPETGDNYWFINQINNTKLIHTFTDGSGKAVRIRYKSLLEDDIYEKGSDGAFPLVDFISPMNVVSSYTISDGLGGQNRISYKYSNGKVHMRGYGFRGFGEVHKIDEQTGLNNVSHYTHDPKLAGSSLEKMVQYDGNNDTLFIHEYSNTYSEYKSSYFSYANKEVVKKFELDGSLATRTITSKIFDDFGNTTRITVNYGKGYVDTIFNYYINDETNWLLGRLSKSVVSRTVPGSPTSRRKSEFEYDFNQVSPSGLLTKEILESGHKLSIEKTYTHDVFGNIVQSTFKGHNGDSLITRTTKSKYSSDGRFLVQLENALGHKETRKYDQFLGNMIAKTDANGLTWEWEFDGIGRDIKERKPDDNVSLTSYMWSDESILKNAPSGSLYALYIQTTAKPTQIVYYDSLDRQLRLETQGFDGRKVFNDYKYNNTGDLVGETQPYFEGDSALWVWYEYDSHNRKTKTTRPGNRIISKIYRGLETITINELGQRTTHTVNPVGHLVSSKNDKGQEIKYEYNSYGNLIGIIDPANNKIEYNYDKFGNLIYQNDPDLHESYFEYNAFNELTKHTDNKGQVVAFRYDNLGREVLRKEQEGETKYYYDSGYKGIGKLDSVVSFNNHLVNYRYDGLGRLQKTVERIENEYYNYAFTYSVYNQLDSLVYPSGFAIRHNYNTLGFLASIEDANTRSKLWENLGQNAKEQLETFKLGNGITTTNTYNYNTGYLTDVKSENQLKKVQLLSFEFDKLGNLVNRKDELQNLSESFTYDNLNRVISSSLNGNENLTLKYDQLGNIIYKSNVGTYEYGNGYAGPHAVTSVNSDSVKNALLPTSYLGKIEYTSFEKVSKIEADKRSVEISYGFAYKRIKQVQKVAERVKEIKYYVGNGFEKIIKGDSTYEKHFIRALGSTFAIRTHLNGKNNTVYLHKDHLGS
ncbi:MAG: VCBS repeat-containing protein, partial [Bacteroidetes bacterium]|nr:VCBS repeat-containing protein [Bacteroidota bacterium]